MHFVIRDNSTSSFPTHIPFISFLAQLFWLWLPVLLCIDATKSRHLFMLLISEKKFLGSYHWVWCWLWAFHTWFLLCWGTLLLFLVCQVFLSERVQNFLKCFFCINWDYHVGFFFILLMGPIINTLIDFFMLSHSCIPGINLTWSWCIIFSMGCWIWLVAFCRVFLHQYSSGTRSAVFFTCSIFVGFWISR